MHRLSSMATKPPAGTNCCRMFEQLPKRQTFAAAEKSLNATVDFDATSDDMELGRRTIASYKMLAEFQAAVDAKDLALGSNATRKYAPGKHPARGALGS